MKRSAASCNRADAKKVKTELMPQSSPNRLAQDSLSPEISPGCDNNVHNRSAINHSVAALKLRLSRPVKSLIRNLDPSWCYHLSKIIESPSFANLALFVEQERSKYTIYPPPEQVFSWSNLSSPEDIRVVILGQDPYHGPQQAHGLAFSVTRPTRPPPSLLNMYKEIAKDPNCGTGSSTTNWPPKHGDLSHWANQGVLLLNAVLTVRQGQANSHKDRGWEQLTSAVVHHINNNCSHVVFLLWGASAQAQGARLDKKRHLVLQAPHPSPLSASRGFFGCGHFSLANDYLRQHNRLPIDWTGL